MALITEDGTTPLATPTCVQAWVEYPFNQRGDSATKVYRHTMQVRRSGYAPLSLDDTMTDADEKPSGSPFGDDADAYWVGDSQPTQAGGDLVEFERTFANIPASRIETAGVYPYNFPGVANEGISTTTIATSTGNESIGSQIGTSGYYPIQFDVSDDDLKRFRAGDGVRLIDTDDDRASGIVSRLDGNTIHVVAPATLLNAGTFTIKSRVFRSSPETFNASSYEVISYQRADSAADLTLKSQFRIYNVVDGLRTDILENSLKDTTFTVGEYVEMIATETELQAEDSSFSRWMGNIWEVRDIKVRAK